MFSRILALLLCAMATESCRGGEEAIDSSAGQDRPEHAAAPLVDHHQHLLSPAAAAVQNAYRATLLGRFLGRVDQPPIGSGQLVVMLDAAGITRAVVLSDAYFFDAPVHARALRDVGVRDTYAAVRAENDWTAREVAQFPHRLVGFCSFNPLKEYARQELERCAETLMFKGLKLHFSASGVDLTNTQHLEQIRRTFEAANSHRLPVVVHVRADRSYGREHATILLNQILPAAPDIPVQIAHLWGGDGYFEGALEALVAYAGAVSARHQATTNLYFDVAQLAFVLDGQSDLLKEMARLIRQIGTGRILYGSDGPMFGNLQPAGAWTAFRDQVPLTDGEFKAIANNIAPYLR